VQTSDGYPVHNLNTGLSYATIQEAINAPETLSGHTILVQEGTYYENIVINKSISLIGENEASTVIDGRSTAPVIFVNVSNVNVSMFTIRNGIKGIKLVEASYCNFRENVITSNIEDGVSLYYSHNNTFVQNVIANNSHKQPERWHGVFLQWSDWNSFFNNTIFSNDNGFRLWYSSYAILRNNSFYNNYHNFDVYGSLWDSANWIHDIDSSNTIDGKPIYYWIDQQNRQVPSNAGYVGVINSRNITVAQIEVTNNAQGVLFFNTNNSIVENVQLYSNGDGICFYRSSNNIIRDSKILNNSCGIVFSTHTGNFHSDNNIIENNTISKNGEGILFGFNSRSNYITGNDIAENDYGIIFGKVMNNSIVRNKVTANSFIGIDLCESSDNSIIENNIVKSGHYGIRLYLSSNDNSIFHNNFIDNTQQAYSENSTNVWDDGYPSGGNYWSNYNGTDLFSGLYQNETGSDGIGDTAYVIDANNTDHYPLMYPWGVPPTPDTTPPTISILSPENKTYPVSDVPLTFTVSESTSWMGYNLDGQANVTITGNTTLSGLSDGSHSLIVYAKDTAGNTGASETIYFTIETKKEQVFPTWIIAAIVIIAIVGVTLLVYFTKVKKQPRK
jgi:parallel beta-helix repeat protein